MLGLDGPANQLLARPRPWLVGVIHLPALPGAPGASTPVGAIAEHAAEDARVLEDAGFTAVMIENFHDVPFRPEHADPETIAALAIVVARVVKAVSLPVGVNVLRNDALAALGVAVAAGGAFVRVNVLSGAAVTDQGLLSGRADELLRRRASLRAPVAILADVDVKHATSLDTRPLPIRAADLVRRAGADGVLVTGHATGQPVDPAALVAVREAVSPAPVLAASGVVPATLGDTLSLCDGAVVGTALKDPATGRIDRARASRFKESLRA